MFGTKNRPSSNSLQLLIARLKTLSFHLASLSFVVFERRKKKTRKNELHQENIYCITDLTIQTNSYDFQETFIQRSRNRQEFQIVYQSHFLQTEICF